MINIQPQYLSLAKLLDRRLFRIPEYQRAYSWGKHQRDDLFEDLDKTLAKGDDESHFMAAMVCLRRKSQTLGTDEYQVMEVVDGQQRLTTLIILLKAIALALDQKDRKEAKLSTELEELLVKVDDDELLLLQTNHDSSRYFANYLRGGTFPAAGIATTIADTQILSAISECRDYVVRWQHKHGSLISLGKLLKNRLFFLLHEIDQEKTVYTVFEVLNSRGLDVSWFDRLKSILMGNAFDLPNTNSAGVIRELQTVWRDIYSVVGLRQGLSTEALRFAATLRTTEAPSRPLGEEDSVDTLRALATSAKGIRQIASWLLDVTKACDAVSANVRINAVTRISQARLLATAIHLRPDLSTKQKALLLARWEKVSFRIYGLLGNDARTRVGDYVRLAWTVLNEKKSYAHISSAIEAVGKDFKISEAADAIRGENCYEGWESELRYFMFRYEEYLAKKQNLNFTNEQWAKIWLVSPSESIEHVWAKSTAPEKHRHRIGNLVLLPPRLNSRLQADPAKDKAKAYRQTGLLIAIDVADRIESDAWNAKAIDKREEELIEWAKTEWAD